MQEAWVLLFGPWNGSVVDFGRQRLVWGFLANGLALLRMLSLFLVVLGLAYVFHLR